MKTEDKIIAKTNVYIVAQELDLFRRKLLKENKRPDLQVKFQSYFDMLCESLDYFQEMDKTITASNKKISELKSKILEFDKELRELKTINKNLEEGL